jgi:hypothetical protein
MATSRVVPIKMAQMKVTQVQGSSIPAFQDTKWQKPIRSKKPPRRTHACSAAKQSSVLYRRCEVDREMKAAHENLEQRKR